MRTDACEPIQQPQKAAGDGAREGHSMGCSRTVFLWLAGVLLVAVPFSNGNRSDEGYQNAL